MKTGFWDRLLIYLYVLITLVITAAMLLRAFGIELVGMFIQGLDANMPGLFWRLIIIGLCAMVCVLGVYVAVVVTPSRKKHNFVTLSSDEGGQVLVSLPAIREMAGQAIRNTKGLEAVVINVTEASDSICVNVNMDVECGVHVPTVTTNMKRAIKTNIERNCGVNVQSVTVEVRNVLPSAEASHIEEVEVVPVVTSDIPVQPVIEPAAEEESIALMADAEEAAADDVPEEECDAAEEIVTEEAEAEIGYDEEAEAAVSEEEAEAGEEPICDAEVETQPEA